MFVKKYGVVLALVCSLSLSGLAQESDGQINPNSTQNIPKYEQLYKVKVWRNVDLREKQNKGFFARGNEITNLIINGVSSGEIADIYELDSLTKKKSKEDFFKDMVSQQGATLDVWDPATDYYQGDQKTFNGKNYEALADSKGKNPESSPNEWQKTTAGKATLFLPNEIYQLQFVEDVIFDKRRSRLYYDILSVKMFAFDLNRENKLTEFVEVFVANA